MFTNPESKVLVLDSGSNLAEVKSVNALVTAKQSKPSLPNYVTRGLVSYWPLTENGAYTGDYHDLAYLLTGSATINNGSRTGSGLPTDGPRSLAFNCTGDDYVNVPAHSSLVFPDSYTYVIWVRNVPSNGVAFSTGTSPAGANTSLLCQSSTIFTWSHSSGGYLDLNPTTQFDNKEWSQVVFTWDKTRAFGQRLQAYVNGIFVKNADTDTGTTNTATPGQVVIGAYTNFSSILVSGHIAEILAYNVALTAEEVKQNFDAVIKDMPISNGLVSYWKLDEDSATGVSVKDSAAKEFDSGSGNDGTRTGTSPQVARGVNGEIVQHFSGDDYITITHNSSLMPTTGFTYVGWANADTATEMYMWAKDTTGFRGGSSTGTNIYFNTGSTNLVFSGGIALNSWNQIAFVHTSSYLRIFVNGVKVAETSGIYSTNTNNLFLGSQNGGQYWRGMMSKWKFYNRPLSSWEIYKSYLQDLGTPNIVTRGLVSWWRLQDNGNGTGIMRDSAYRTFGIGASTPNDGTKTGTCNSVSGRWGQALDLSGDDYVTPATIESYVNIDKTYSIGWWMLYDNSVTNASFWGMGVSGNFLLGYKDSTNFQFYCQTSGGNHYKNFTCTDFLNSWHYYTLTYDGSRNNTGYKLYVDGVLQSGTVGGTSPLTGSVTGTAFGIGKSPSFNGLVGKMQDFKTYNVELTASEVLQNYNAYRRGI